MLPEQVLLLLLIIVGASSFLSVKLDQAVVATIILLIVVSAGGLWQTARLAVHLGDFRLQYLGYVWLLKIVLIIFVLFAGWIPELDPSSGSWGYDPQRYYVQAQELIDNNWSSKYISLNYTGVLYYYGAIFYLLGHNPVIPALVNIFVTLMAVLYLVRVGYEITDRRTPKDWRIGLAMILPEVLWFDVMTSRESIMMALITVMLLSAGRYLIREKKSSFYKTTLIVLLCGLAIGALRTSMLISVLGALSLMVAILRPPRKRRRSVGAIALFIVALGAFVSAPFVSAYLGSYEFDYGDKLASISQANLNIAGHQGVWREDSVGALLLPSNAFEAVLFTFPRMVAYLVSPLAIELNISDLIQGGWTAWQRLLVSLSSMINIIVFPLVLASLFRAVMVRKKDSRELVFHVPYWATFFAIATGNMIIHDRYRIMASLLLWGCVWIGLKNCPRYMIRNATVSWIFILGAGVCFYIGYKYL